MERSRRVTQGKITKKLTILGQTNLEPNQKTVKKAEEAILAKAELVANIQSLKQDLDDTKGLLKKTDKRITYDSLPENEKFKGLEPTRKKLLDTIRMIAYRAETAMATMSEDFFSAPDTARSWIKALMASNADILPDIPGRKLEVRIYPLGEDRMNQMLENLFKILNDTQTAYPGTDLILNYTLLKISKVSQTLFPRGQELRI